MIIKIIRRRRPGPMRTFAGVVSNIYVTYSTNRLAPETIQIPTADYTSEIEEQMIIARIMSRLGITTSEFEFTFTAS